jgi:hypothetical protein
VVAQGEWGMSAELDRIESLEAEIAHLRLIGDELARHLEKWCDPQATGWRPLSVRTALDLWRGCV